MEDRLPVIMLWTREVLWNNEALSIKVTILKVKNVNASRISTDLLGQYLVIIGVENCPNWPFPTSSQHCVDAIRFYTFSKLQIITLTNCYPIISCYIMSHSREKIFDKKRKVLSNVTFAMSSNEQTRRYRIGSRYKWCSLYTSKTNDE